MSAQKRAQSKTEALWMASVTLTVAALGLMLQGLLDLSLTTIGVGVAAVAGLAGFLAPKKPNDAKRRFLPPLLLFPVVLFAFWYFMTMAFGHFGLGPILFHMDYGTRANGVVGAFFAQWVMEFIYSVTLITGVWMLSAIDYRFRQFDHIAVLPMLIANPLTLATLEYVGDAEAAAEQLVFGRFVDTTDLAPADGAQPNLIHIFLESSERTLNDARAFGDVMAPLAPFVARGAEFTNIEEAALTNWTLAGQVAAHCGVPLMPLGLVNRNNFHVSGDAFMSEATCLGDLLTRDGYRTAFMKAAPLSFAGADKYAASHGWQQQLGFTELREQVRAGMNEWGMHDEDIYDALYRQVVDMAKSGKRYAISATNIGGHAPHGYLSPKCHTRPTVTGYGNPILQSFRCSHELVAELLERLEQEGYLKNTIVVLQSDHLAMRNAIYSDLKTRDRRNFFVAFGPGIEPQVIDRDMTMMDIYPTILELLGYAPLNGQAGVGVSAFADRPTLIEELGLPELDKAIFADSDLRNRLWGISPAS